MTTSRLPAQPSHFLKAQMRSGATNLHVHASPNENSQRQGGLMCARTSIGTILFGLRTSIPQLLAACCVGDAPGDINNERKRNWTITKRTCGVIKQHSADRLPVPSLGTHLSVSLTVIAWSQSVSDSGHQNLAQLRTALIPKQ